MLNMKYYLFLMIGIFLALGLGILMGISLESKDVLENQQRLIAREIEEKFISLRTETEQLKDNLSLQENEKKDIQSLCEVLFSEVVSNRLSGLRVSLIETSEQHGYSDLIGLLKMAGASIESNITLQTKVYNQTENLEVALHAFWQQGSQDRDVYRSIVEDLVYSVYHGTTTPLIERLKELNVLQSMTEIENGCDVIILAGSGFEKDKTPLENVFDIQFIETALDKGIPVIAVEAEKIDNTLVPHYKEFGISTVDNVDTLYGRLALISILQGSQGNFGIKEGSQSLLPDPLFIPELIEENEEEYQVGGELP